MAKKPDFYAILGVTRNASQEEIKRAYFEAAQRLHPDKNKAVGETEIFLEVQRAYETLSNLARRKRYDASLPPEDRSALGFHARIYYSRPNLVRMNEAQMLYVLLEVTPENNEEIAAPPLNVSLVLDRSTSMKDEKMDVLKNAAINVMRNLRPQDIFSVVTFSDRAEVLIPASYPYDKKKLESNIQMLHPSGATEIFQGLQAGYNEIQQNASQERIDHIILLTDGHTYGDEQQCISLAEQASTKGIGISAMGIGNEWNDTFLDALASRTGGSSRYISRTEDIQRFLVEKFETFARTLADDVVLEIKGSTPGAEMAYAFRTQPETGPLPIEESIHLGPVLKDSTLSVLFEYRIDPAVTQQDRISLVSGQLKLSIAGLPRPVQPIAVEFSREVKKEAGGEPPPSIIIKSLGRLTLYRMQEKAHVEVSQGQYDLAARHMKQLATTLLMQGERSLARTALIEAENIEKMQSFSDEGRKEIKYGTRALIMIPEKEFPV